jgi:hypothetical protein
LIEANAFAAAFMDQSLIKNGPIEAVDTSNLTASEGFLQRPGVKPGCSPQWMQNVVTGRATAYPMSRCELVEARIFRAVVRRQVLVAAF